MAGNALGDYGTADENTTGTTPTYSTFDELLAVKPSIIGRKIITKRGGAPSYMFDTLAPDIPAQKITSDTTETYENMIRAIYGSKPDDLYDLQQRLQAGGFYGKNPDYIDKTPDDNTRNSWDDVLKIAALSDKTPDEVIDQAIEANGGLEAALAKYKKTGSGGAPSVRLTHPDDIRAVANQVSAKTLGVGWDRQQLDKFVRAYQSMEKAEGETPGTRVGAPSVEHAVEAEARRQNPTAAGATDWDKAAHQIMNAFNILGGGTNG